MKAVEDFSNQLLRLISFPLDFLVACKDAIANLLMFPFRALSRGISDTKKVGGSLVDYFQSFLRWLFNLPSNLLSSLVEKFGTTYHQVGSLVSSQIEMAVHAAYTSSFGRFLQKASRRMSGWFPRSRVRWSKFNHRIAEMATSIKYFGKRCFGPLRRVLDQSLLRWSRIQVRDGWDAVTQRQVYRDYHRLNRLLADWALSVENMILRQCRRINGWR
jgi:hypothetical protein